MRSFAVASLLLLPSLASAAPPAEAEPAGQAAYRRFAEARRGECVGPPGRLDTPLELTVKGRRYRLDGHRLVELARDDDDVLRIGVLSATKDDREETRAAIRELMRRLVASGIDVLLVNGDLAGHEVDAAESLLPALAESGVLTVLSAGNADSCGSFNQALERARVAAPHLVNGNWVRQLELDDGTLFTLPGYFDRRFAHTAGAARYDAADLETLGALLTEGPAPKVLVSHGPPKMVGPHGLDLTLDGGHVGDEGMTELIEEARVSFGIFGHILEAGGRGSDLGGHAARKPGAWYPSLFVNAGSANPDPWPMLDGKTSYGMAMLVKVRPSSARFEVFRLAAPR